MELILKFDATAVPYKSIEFDERFIGSINDADIASGIIKVAAIALPSFTDFDAPIFSMSLDDTDPISDFAVTVSDLVVDEVILESSSLIFSSEPMISGLSLSLLGYKDNDISVGYQFPESGFYFIHGSKANPEVIQTVDYSTSNIVGVDGVIDTSTELKIEFKTEESIQSSEVIITGFNKDGILEVNSLSDFATSHDSADGEWAEFFNSITDNSIESVILHNYDNFNISVIVERAETGLDAIFSDVNPTPFQIVNSGSANVPVLDFYFNESKDFDGDGVGSFDITLSFDPADVNYASLSFANGLIGSFNENLAASGTVYASAIKYPHFQDLDTPLFSMTMNDVDFNEDFSITVSELVVDGSYLEDFTFLII